MKRSKMSGRFVGCVALITCFLLTANVCTAGDAPESGVIFEDNFDEGLSDKWQIIGLETEDYRIRDGGLEIRVQPCKENKDTPMLKVVLPFQFTDTVVAQVDITILDKLTENEEFAGLFLMNEEYWEFPARQQKIHGRTYYTPGYYTMIDEDAYGDNDRNNERLSFRPVNDDDGPLKILVDREWAFLQVGPSTYPKAKQKVVNGYYHAIVPYSKEPGFALMTGNGPSDKEHWVRFDNFQVKVLKINHR